MAENINLTAEQLNNLTEDQVASIGEQIFNMMQRQRAPQQGQPQRATQQKAPMQRQVPVQGQMQPQRAMPNTQQKPARPPRMPASMSRGVKSVIQNRYGGLPNPQQMAMQQPMQQPMQMPQFAPQPQMYQPLYGQQQMQQRPFYAMNLNPYMMRG